MLTDKQRKRYIKSKQFQKDCNDFNKRFVSLLNWYTDEMKDNKFDKFAEIVLPTLLIGHISTFFENHFEHSEESLNGFVDSIKSTIRSDCNIEEEYQPYTLIDDIGAVA